MDVFVRAQGIEPAEVVTPPGARGVPDHGIGRSVGRKDPAQCTEKHIAEERSFRRLDPLCKEIPIYIKRPVGQRRTPDGASPPVSGSGGLEPLYTWGPPGAKPPELSERGPVASERAGSMKRWEYQKAKEERDRSRSRAKNKKRTLQRRRKEESRDDVSITTRALANTYSEDTGRDPELRRAWSDWLGKLDWQWFCTFTFNRDVPPIVAVRSFSKWYQRLSQTIKSIKQDGPIRLRYLASCENTYRGRVHIHAVLGGEPEILQNLRRATQMGRWESLPYGSCGMSRIYPAHGKAVSYTLKYVAKGKGCRLLAGGAFSVGSPPGLPVSSPISVPNPDEGRGKTITLLM